MNWNDENYGTSSDLELRSRGLMGLRIKNVKDIFTISVMM